MSAFLELLRSEWRGQRCLVIAILSGTPVLYLLVAEIDSSFLVEQLGYSASRIGMGISLMLAALLVGSELLPGIIRNDHLDFVQRLPSSKAALYSAKLGFLFAVLLAVASVHAMTTLVVGTATASPLLLVLPALGLGCIAMAISAWLQQGSFAAAGTVLYVLCLSLGALAARTVEPWFFPDSTWLAVMLFIALPITGLLASYLSMLAYRQGAGTLKATLFGLPPALVLVLVACLSAWSMREDWLRVDAHSGFNEIGRVEILSKNEIYIELHRGSVWTKEGSKTRAFPIIVDLAEELWWETGKRLPRHDVAKAAKALDIRVSKQKKYVRTRSDGQTEYAKGPRSLGDARIIGYLDDRRFLAIPFSPRIYLYSFDTRHLCVCVPCSSRRCRSGLASPA